MSEDYEVVDGDFSDDPEAIDPEFVRKKKQTKEPEDPETKVITLDDILKGISKINKFLGDNGWEW